MHMGMYKHTHTNKSNQINIKSVNRDNEGISNDKRVNQHEDVVTGHKLTEL